MEEIAVVEVGLQEGVRDDGTTWSRWKVKDGNSRTLSYFQNAKTADWPKILVQGKHARVEIETKDLGGGRTVNNIVAVEAIGNGSVPEQYSHQKPTGEADWDKVALGKTRCALWNHFLSGELAANLYARAVSEHAKDPTSYKGSYDPMDYVIVTGTRLVVHAEKDVFERPPGDDGIPFETDGPDAA